MFSRFAALSGAILVATGTAFTTGVEAKTFSNGSNQSDNDATLIWRGDTGSRKCSLTAIEEGEVALSADGNYLQSEGEKPAVLGYETFGASQIQGHDAALGAGPRWTNRRVRSCHVVVIPPCPGRAPRMSAESQARHLLVSQGVVHRRCGGLLHRHGHIWRRARLPRGNRGAGPWLIASAHPRVVDRHQRRAAP